MLKGLLRTIRKIYLSHNIVLLMILVVLPVGVSVYMLDLFSSQIVQHIPVGIVRQDDSQLSDELERKLRSSPVLDIHICSDNFECEHAVIRGEMQTFIVFPNDMERRVLRLETPVIPIYSSGQNYLTNMFATKEIRSIISSVGSSLYTAQIPDPVKVEIHSVGNEQSNYQGFLGLGLMTAMFHLAGILVAVYLASRPLRDNTVHELLESVCHSRVTLWVSTFVPMAVILWLEMMGCYAFTRRALTPMIFEEFVIVSAAQLFMILACMGAGITFAGVTGIMRVATGAAGVVGGPAFAFAGQTYPVMAMPFAVRCFAFLLPLTHVLVIQSTMLLGDVGMAYCMRPMAVLIGMALFWNLLGAMLLNWRWTEHDKMEIAQILSRVTEAGK